MVTYSSAGKYIESCTTLKAKITAIDAIIDALILTAANSAADDNINEYWLDDGQTKIKTIYKGTHAIYRSIRNFETLKQQYVQRLNGRVTRLVDGKNFTGDGYC